MSDYTMPFFHRHERFVAEYRTRASVCAGIVEPRIANHRNQEQRVNEERHVGCEHPLDHREQEHRLPQQRALGETRASPSGGR